MPHRVAKSLERTLYGAANGIISMSHRGRKVIEEMPAVSRNGAPVIVVPSCVDLDLFQSEAPKPPLEKDVIRLIYIGSVGGRYILDRVGRFVAMAVEENDRVRLRVLTRADRQLVASMLKEGGLADDSWSTDCVSYRSMPACLAESHAGLFFLARGISEHGCSPTKIGEYWAMGLPVITTPGVSDTDEIIKSERVGVIVREHSDDEYRRAFRELLGLLEEPGLDDRCRRAAKAHYALGPACVRQMELYEDVLLRSSRATRRSEFGKA
jgi:glycosyltransferase involved in cell wall biosynthesis